MSLIPKLNRNEKIIDERGNLTERAYLFFSSLADLGIFTGSGSPEGLLEGPIDSLYKNTSGDSTMLLAEDSPTPTLFIKKFADIAGDRTMGWEGIGGSTTSHILLEDGYYLLLEDAA